MEVDFELVRKKKTFYETLFGVQYRDDQISLPLGWGPELSLGLGAVNQISYWWWEVNSPRYF